MIMINDLNLNVLLLAVCVIMTTGKCINNRSENAALTLLDQGRRVLKNLEPNILQSERLLGEYEDITHRKIQRGAFSWALQVPKNEFKAWLVLKS